MSEAQDKPRKENARPPQPEVVVMQGIYAQLRSHTDTIQLCQTLATQKIRIDAALAVTESMRARLKQAEDQLLELRHGRKVSHGG